MKDMATNSSGKVESSEETFDYTCSVCLKKNKTSEAAKYCQECNKYLCTSCLDQHNEYLEDHILVQPIAADSGTVMPTEKCRTHGQKLIELWCTKHDEVLCNTCAFMDHRSCKDVKFIPAVIKDVFQDADLQKTIKGLEITKDRLATLKNGQSVTGDELMNDKKKYLDMVVQHQKKIIQMVESLGRVAMEEINVWYNENKNKIDKYQNCCDQVERDAINCLQQLKSSSENKSQLFVSMKRGRKLLKTAKKLFSQKEIQMKPDKEFGINPDIAVYLDSVQSLGFFKKRKQLYKVIWSKQVNVKSSHDSNVCDISDTCLLSDGFILMADSNNKKLKRLDMSTCTVTDHCDLPGSPYAVCCVGQEEAAISLDYMIQFVSLGKTMDLTRSIAVNHDCYGIVYTDRELFVSDGGKIVYVYSLSGKLLRSISHNPSGVTLFSQTRRLASSEDRIYVADMYKGLVCMDRNGTELHRYRGAQVKGGCGICTDGQGSIILCGYNSHNVVQVEADGEEFGVVLTQVDGLKKPRSVCFDPRKQKLIVTNYNNDDVLEFDLV